MKMGGGDLSALKTRIAELYKEHSAVIVQVAKKAAGEFAPHQKAVADLLPRLQKAQKGEAVEFSEAEKATLQAASKAGEKLLALSEIFPVAIAEQLKTMMGLAKAAESSNVIQATLNFAEDEDANSDLVNLKADYISLRLDVAGLRLEMHTRFVEYCAFVLNPLADAYNAAYDEVKNKLQEHKDALKAAEETKAAVVSVAVIVGLSGLSSSGIVLSKIENLLATKMSREQVVATVEKLAPWVNVAEDLLQAGADKYLTVNVSVDSKISLSVQSPEAFRTAIVQNAVNKWGDVDIIVQKSENFLKAQEAVYSKAILTDRTVPKSELKIFREQFAEAKKAVEELGSTIRQNLPSGAGFVQSFWRKEFELMFWSKIMYSFRWLEMLTVDFRISPEPYHDYAKLTWPLINHWKTLGILDRTPCNPEGIDFRSMEWSWNDEIDQLIQWAKCYTYPEVKF